MKTILRTSIFLLVIIPSISYGGVFFNDTNLGSTGAPLILNSQSAYDIDFANGLMRVIKSNGYVGIGTTAPAYNFDVIGTGSFSGTLKSGTPTGGTHAVTKSYVDSILGGGVGVGTSGQTMRNSGSGWVASSLLYNNSTAIGIGTTSPANLLHVFASAPTNNVLTTLQSGTNTSYLKFISTGTNWQIGPTAQGFQFYNNDTSATRVTITSGGNLGIGSTTPTVPLDVVGNGVFTGTVTLATPTTGTHAATKGYVDSTFANYWITTSTDIYASSTLNVGIGTATPTTRLDVNGIVRATGIRIGTTATAGRVLKSDASGVGTWGQLIVAAKPGGAVFTARTTYTSPASPSFVLEANTSAVSSYFTCPTGYTLWSNGNAYWYSSGSGNAAYFGACYPSSATEDMFVWKAYSSPSSVTCPTGYTKWSNNSYGGWGEYSSYNAFNGICYKGTPSSFTWETYTGHGNPTSFITCPSGYTAWYHANAQWYSSYSGYYNYTGSCYNASATSDVFTWRSNSVASVTCPSGYTKWNAGQLSYGPGNMSYTSGACYKGTPTSFTWELYDAYSPDSNITCPSGYTRWWGSTAKYYNSNSYFNYNGACILTAGTQGDAFRWLSSLSADATACPTGYTKWNGNASYFRYTGTGNATYNYACYKQGVADCNATCPSGWTRASCNQVSESGTDITEAVCYKLDSASQAMVISKKGSSQSISCPSGWSAATSTLDIGGNTERTCYYEICTTGYTVPNAPTSPLASSGDTEATVYWSAPTGTACSQASSYNLYRSTTSGSGFVQVATGITATSKIDTGLTNGTTYYYKISAVNSAGEGTQSSEVSVTPQTALYAFTSHTFTNCSATGQYGPSVAQCRSAYTTAWDENSSYFNVTSGIQYWTVPADGIYRIEAYGADGGTPPTSYPSNIPGKGSRMRGDFVLTKSSVIKILVGQRGLVGGNDTGGGGGTFVATNSNTPLIVAGGGGGASYTTPYANGIDAVTGTSGTAGANGGTGGSSGNGGVSVGCAGAGAGLTGAGGNGPSCGSCGGGVAFTSGGNGGTCGYATVGGFGGGGGTHGGGWGGGGGGGYSGGGGSTSSQYGGGGGGSYNNGTNQSNSAGANTGHGSVTITKL